MGGNSLKRKGGKGYEKLVLWQNAYRLRKTIYEITARFPRAELRRVSQMRDAARSVKQNVQEGYKRRSIAEYIQALTIAQGSLGELGGDLQDCFDDKLINKNEFLTLDELSGKTDFLFNRLIRALTQKKKNGTWVSL